MDEGSTVVELGAGTGSFTVVAAQTGVSVIAVDPSLAMVDALRARTAELGLSGWCAQQRPASQLRSASTAYAHCRLPTVDTPHSGRRDIGLTGEQLVDDGRVLTGPSVVRDRRAVGWPTIQPEEAAWREQWSDRRRHCERSQPSPDLRRRRLWSEAPVHSPRRPEPRPGGDRRRTGRAPHPVDQRSSPSCRPRRPTTPSPPGTVRPSAAAAEASAELDGGDARTLLEHPMQGLTRSEPA